MNGYTSTAVAVNGLSSSVAAISAARVHTCALLTAGSVQCWGANISGELGDGTTAYKITPVTVHGLSNNVAAISAGGAYPMGGHTCALTTMGSVHCWGNNDSGQLGDGTTISKSTPIPVDGLSSGVVD